MPRLQARLAKETKVNIGRGGEGEWPTDCPVMIEVERVMGMYDHPSAGRAEGLLGHSITMDFYTKGGIKVVLKSYHDPNGLAIEVDGERLFYWTQNPDDLPRGVKAVREEQLRQDGAWAEQMELEPGDDVSMGDDGIMVVTREVLGPEIESSFLGDDDEILEEDYEDG